MAWTDRSGIRVSYAIEGAGPPLVLLHGLGTSRELWQVGGYVDALRDHFQLVLIDARGHGGSDRPTEVTDYGMPKHAADVVGVLDELGIEAASLLGFSLGGGTALEVAALHPHRTRAIVTIGAAPSNAEFADVPANDPTSLLEQAALFETQGMSWLAALLESEARPRWAALMRKSDGHPQALQCRSWAAPPSARPLLAGVRAPALMIWGEDDVPRPLPELPPSAQVMIIPGADHAGALEAIDVVLPAVLEFLANAMGEQ